MAMYLAIVKLHGKTQMLSVSIISKQNSNK